ncbi:hypothetical protein K438DRAFT_1785430 [Mycena galopus ATCC 62051]|nr:hypothetical protein K438DRAFT_1785430 [Mycena galopus ATCC 62051]
MKEYWRTTNIQRKHRRVRARINGPGTEMERVYTLGIENTGQIGSVGLNRYGMDVARGIFFQKFCGIVRIGPLAQIASGLIGAENHETNSRKPRHTDLGSSETERFVMAQSVVHHETSKPVKQELHTAQLFSWMEFLNSARVPKGTKHGWGPEEHERTNIKWRKLQTDTKNR